MRIKNSRSTVLQLTLQKLKLHFQSVSTEGSFTSEDALMYNDNCRKTVVSIMDSAMKLFRTNKAEIIAIRREQLCFKSIEDLTAEHSTSSADDQSSLPFCQLQHLFGTFRQSQFRHHDHC